MIILCAAIFVMGLVGSLFLLNRPHGTWIEIVQDNEVLYRLNLADAEDQTIEIEYEGRVNIVQIENHKVRMLEADCPDYTCINMGWLDSSMPIVCLPNHLVIQRMAGAVQHLLHLSDSAGDYQPVGAERPAADRQ